jgi:hypothetical protein
MTLAGMLQQVGPHVVIATRCSRCGRLFWGWYDRGASSKEAIAQTRVDEKKSWDDCFPIIKGMLERAAHTGTQHKDILVALSRFPAEVSSVRTMPGDQFLTAEREQLLAHFKLNRKWWQLFS